VGLSIERKEEGIVGMISPPLAFLSPTDQDDQKKKLPNSVSFIPSYYHRLGSF
jgi:hypothetical protein